MARFALALIVALTAQVGLAQEKMPAKVRDHINKHYIGNWEFVAKSDNEVVKGTLSAKWAPGNHCVLVTQEFGTPDGAVHESGIVAWEPDKGTIVHHGFVSDGDYFRITYDKLDGDTWSGQMTGLVKGKWYENLDASVVWSPNGLHYSDKLLDYVAKKK